MCTIRRDGRNMSPHFVCVVILLESKSCIKIASSAVLIEKDFHDIYEEHGISSFLFVEFFFPGCGYINTPNILYYLFLKRASTSPTSYNICVVGFERPVAGHRTWQQLYKMAPRHHTCLRKTLVGVSVEPRSW